MNEGPHEFGDQLVLTDCVRRMEVDSCPARLVGRCEKGAVTVLQMLSGQCCRRFGVGKGESPR